MIFIFLLSQVDLRTSLPKSMKQKIWWTARQKNKKNLLILHWFESLLHWLTSLLNQFSHCSHCFWLNSCMNCQPMIESVVSLMFFFFFAVPSNRAEEVNLFGSSSIAWQTTWWRGCWVILWQSEIELCLINKDTFKDLNSLFWISVSYVINTVSNIWAPSPFTVKTGQSYGHSMLTM